MFRLSALHDGRGVNTNTVVLLLLSLALRCSQHLLQRVASKTPSPLCSRQSVKWAGRLVCAQIDAGHGALVAISVLQDVLLTALLCWAKSQPAAKFVFAEQLGQGWDLRLLSPALSWGQGFCALGFCGLWQMISLQRQTPRGAAAPPWAQRVGSSSFILLTGLSVSAIVKRCTCLILMYGKDSQILPLVPF